MLISWFGGYGDAVLHVLLFYMYCLTGVSAGAGPHIPCGTSETTKSGTSPSNDVLVECRVFTAPGYDSSEPVVVSVATWVFERRSQGARGLWCKGLCENGDMSASR